MFIYLITDGHTNFSKIGISKNVENRLKQLQIANPNNLKIIKVFKTKFEKKTESTLHNIFKNKKIAGEWFNLDQNDVDKFSNTCSSIEENLAVLKKFNNPYF